MADYNFTANWGACNLGPFDTAAQAAIFPGLTFYNPPPPTGTNAPYYVQLSIADGIGKAGGRAMKFHYPAGTFTMAFNYPAIQLAPVGNKAVHMEWDLYFAPGFPFQNGSNGKPPMCLVWGQSSGTSGGISNLFWWSSNSSSPPRMPAICQNQRSGSPLAGEFLTGQYGPVSPAPPLVAGQWYHLCVEIRGGADGYGKWWKDGVLIASLDNTSPAWQLTNTTDIVQAQFFTTFGGAGSPPAADCEAYVDNLHIWTDFPDAASFQASST